MLTAIIVGQVSNLTNSPTPLIDGNHSGREGEHLNYPLARMEISFSFSVNPDSPNDWPTVAPFLLLAGSFFFLLPWCNFVLSRAVRWKLRYIFSSCKFSRDLRLLFVVGDEKLFLYFNYNSTDGGGVTRKNGAEPAKWGKKFSVYQWNCENTMRGMD